MIPSCPGKWEFWIDRGGTFTDIVGMDPKGKVRLALLFWLGEQAAGVAEKAKT